MPQRPNNFTINRNHDLAQGLVFAGLGAHAGSTRYHDSSAYGNTGTLTNMDPATDWVPTPRGVGIDCDGSNDFVSMGDNFAIGDTYSISFWIYLRSHAAYACMIVKASGNAGTACDFGLKFNGAANSGVWLNVRSGTDGSAGTAIPLDTWAHIVSIVGPDTSQQWMNAVRTRNDAGIGGATTSNTATRIFAIGRNFSLYTSAIFANVLCHSRAINTAEIQQIADPSNFMLSGLIQNPQRKWWPVVAAAPASTARNLILGGGVL